MASAQRDRLDARHLAEIDQRRIEMTAVAEAGVFVRPVLDQFVYAAMCRDEAVRPERDAAVVQTAIDLVGRRLEDRSARDRHAELAVDAAQSRQNAFAHLADEFHRKAACFAFGGNTVLGEARRTELSGQ